MGTQSVLTAGGLFTDEADAVRAEEVIPVGLMDESCTVLAFLVAVGPVVRLTRFPLAGTRKTGEGKNAF